MIEKDFSDWLSPMLVKEMRQGFRSRVFVFAFLLIQGLMIFCVLLGLNFSAGDSDFSNTFFWFIICAPLLLLPLLGLNVLGSEINQNTMELLFLTRLSAWRIVVGKWTAIVAQMLLIVCSVLPYLVLRYFIGGVNLLDDLSFLAWLFCTSAILTGVAIASSPFYRSMLTKLFVIVGAIILAIMLMGFLENPANAISMTGVDAAQLTAIALCLGPLFLLLMFETAVSKIAPPAENHSFRKRLIGLVILGAIAVLNHGAIAKTDLLMVLGAALVLPICLTALCEEVKPIPSIYLPFVKRGFLGRIIGMVFYPGWPSGLVFTILAFGIYLAIFFRDRNMTERSMLLIISMAGALVMPAAVEKIAFTKLRKPAVVYYSLQAFMAIVCVLASMLKDTSLERWMLAASPLPTSVFFLEAFDKIDTVDRSTYTLTSMVVLVISLAVLLVKCIGPRRQIAAYEKQARETLMKKPAPAPEIANASAA
ncbi:MAG TPA: hypothetical protein VG733_00995 [Chthoniobacteraceae bacterium]|nr:hypothetical protein [Chthoniobacteraceae bacterium]